MQVKFFFTLVQHWNLSRGDQWTTMVPSYYQNQCWLIIRRVIWYSSKTKFAGRAKTLFGKIASTSLSGQTVKPVSRRQSALSNRVPRIILFTIGLRIVVISEQQHRDYAAKKPYQRWFLQRWFSNRSCSFDAPRYVSVIRPRPCFHVHSVHSAYIPIELTSPPENTPPSITMYSSVVQGDYVD